MLLRRLFIREKRINLKASSKRPAVIEVAEYGSGGDRETRGTEQQ